MTPTEHLERWIEAADKPDDWPYPCRDCDGTLHRSTNPTVWCCPQCGDWFDEELLAGYAEGAAMAARIIRDEEPKT